MQRASQAALLAPEHGDNRSPDPAISKIQQLLVSLLQTACAFTWPMAAVAVAVLAVAMPGSIHDWVTHTNIVEVGAGGAGVAAVFGLLLIAYGFVLIFVAGDPRLNDFGAPNTPPEKPQPVAPPARPEYTSVAPAPATAPSEPTYSHPGPPVFGRRGAQA